MATEAAADAPEARPPSAPATESEREDGEIEDESGSEGQAVTPAPAQVHLLEHAWTFWFDNQEVKMKAGEWGSNIIPVYTFSTVEDFWRLYNNISTPGKLNMKVELHCFKNKIEPKWEDPICANGGKWTITCPRGRADMVWLYTLLAMIGEQFDHGDEICGAVVSVRPKQDKVAIWTKDAANEAAQVSIGKQWKSLLDIKDSIGFIVHDDAKNSKAPKNKYTV